jgi:LacI family transcriptional regulator
MIGYNDEYIGHLVQQGIPAVAHSREVQANGVDNIFAPNEEGAYLATRHLIEQGHRKIGLVCGPQELNTGRDRLQGYLRALSEFGIPPDDERIKGAAFQKKFGALAAAELLGVTSRPTAVFVVGGEFVIGLMKTFL